MEYYAVIKNKEILLLVTTWMDLEGSRLSKISQGEKDKLYDLTYMWNLKQRTKNKKPHTKFIEKDQICGYQRQGLGGEGTEEGGQKVQTSSYKIN